jgi:hypothetical protein
MTKRVLPEQLDFTRTYSGPINGGGRPITSKEKKAARRRMRKYKMASEKDLALVYKPVEEWDAEELARGRPRAQDGSFRGKAPPFVDRALHEEIVKKFETVVKSEMNGHTVKALTMMGIILDDDSVDNRGRPIVSASTKLDASKFLIEHVLGKPKQHTQSDISVKLQGILATAMVNPNLAAPGTFALTQGYTDATSTEDEEEDD